MLQMFYNAVSGLSGSQNWLDVTSNNLANQNTAGYQAQRANFEDLSYRDIAAKKTGLQTGSGVKLESVSTSFSGGGLQETEKTYDVTIEENGYFGVQDQAGNTYYTKDGNFKLAPSASKAGNYLVTQNGDYVLDSSGKKIQIKDGQDVHFAGTSVKTDTKKGTISLGIYGFTDPDGLTRDGNNQLSATEASGKAVLLKDANVVQGKQKESNVDVTEEMENLIVAQRGYQLNAQALRTADELEQTANTLRQ